MPKAFWIGSHQGTEEDRNAVLSTITRAEISPWRAVPIPVFEWSGTLLLLKRETATLQLSIHM
jgi:hypothetical protein